MRCAGSLLLGLFMLVGIAQTTAAQDEAALRVTANAPDAVLFADSVRLGRAGQELFRVESGRHRLRLTPGDADSWSAPAATRTVRLAPGETLRVAMRIPYRYHVGSAPFGASVYLRRAAGRKRLGKTPLLYESERPLRSSLVVEKSGYEAAVIEPDSARWTEYTVQLSPSADMPSAATEVDWSPPERRRTWIDATAGGVALAAGATAIYYKFEADRINDKYRSGPQQGDESLRPRFERYDRRSAVALGVMQAGITVFAVRLALR
jgi:hypothetical protein